MHAAGEKEDKEYQRIALKYPSTWELKNVIGDESGGSKDIDLQVLMPEHPFSRTIH